MFATVLLLVIVCVSGCLMQLVVFSIFSFPSPTAPLCGGQVLVGVSSFDLCRLQSSDYWGSRLEFRVIIVLCCFINFHFIWLQSLEVTVVVIWDYINKTEMNWTDLSLAWRGGLLILVWVFIIIVWRAYVRVSTGLTIKTQLTYIL